MPHHDVPVLDAEVRRPDAVFELEFWRVITEDRAGAPTAEATVKLSAQGRRTSATAEGTGPVNALERALRQALQPDCPEVARFALVDCEVQVIEGNRGTTGRSRVRVGVSDGQRVWHSTAVAHNVLEASCEALRDAFTYGLQRARRSTGGAPGRRRLDAPPPESTACRLTVTLQDSPGALGRLASAVRSMPVEALSYVVPDAGPATAEIVVPRAHAVRAQGRLNRMVDVLTVTESAK